MKKPHLHIFVSVTAIFAAFTLGMFVGRNQDKNALVVSVPAVMETAPPETSPSTEASVPETTAVRFPIDINTAEKEEFMALPGIGEVLALRIIAYREENGDYSSVEGLMNVEGIGEKRMEDILDLIVIGG